MSAPKRPKTHILGDKGILASQTIFNDWGWTAEVITNDYGEDLECNIFNNGFRTTFHFRCQVKSVSKNSSYIRKLRNGEFSFSLKTSLARIWASVFYPVLFIIYDDEANEVFWTEVTSQIRNDTSKLQQKTTTIYVSKKNCLKRDKVSLEKCIIEHYERLYRIENSIYTVDVYPLIMPGYKSIFYNDYSEIFTKAESSLNIDIDICSGNLDELPSWTSVIKTTHPGNIGGFTLRSKKDTFYRDFIDQVTKFIELCFPNLEWTSYVISPMYIHSKGENYEVDRVWSTQITDWVALSKIHGKLVQDDNYTFKKPYNFLAVSHKHASSWSGEYLINPDLDVAVRFFSKIETPRSYFSSQECSKKHLLAQMIPWKTPKDTVEAINQLLSQFEICFREVDGLSDDPQVIRGIIAPFMFEPYYGFYQMMTNWDDLENNYILNTLNNNHILDKICGQTDNEEALTQISGVFDYNDIPNQVAVTDSDYINGMPLLHDNRLIEVSRFRFVDQSSLKKISEEFEKTKESLVDMMKHVDSLTVELIIEDHDQNHVAAISSSWKPLMELQSDEALFRYLPLVLAHYDYFMPSVISESGKIGDTFDILRFIGRLYFHGDDSWRPNYSFLNPTNVQFFTEKQSDEDLLKTMMESSKESKFK